MSSIKNIFLFIIFIFLLTETKIRAQSVISDTTDCSLITIENINFDAVSEDEVATVKNKVFTIPEYTITDTTIYTLLSDIMQKHKLCNEYSDSLVFLVRIRQPNGVNVNYELYIDGYQSYLSDAYRLAGENAKGYFLFQNTIFFLFKSEATNTFFSSTEVYKSFSYKLLTYKNTHTGEESTKIEFIDGHDSSFLYEYLEGKFMNIWFYVCDAVRMYEFKN